MADPDRNDPTAREETKSHDHFLKLMLFQPSDVTGGPHAPRPLERMSGPFTALRQSRASAHAAYHLPHPGSTAPVRLDSPAIEVMTDLRRVEAITIGRMNLIEEANRTMIAHGVRALFVVDDHRAVVGIITATDILGERPVQITHSRGIRHDEVIVRDIMTPADRLEVIDLDDVRIARVGDVIATLKQSGRQHALVVDQSPKGSGAPQYVRGIFSLTQIARQLGLPPQPLHDIGRTFAEIEAAIAS